MMEMNLTFPYVVCFKNCGLTEGVVALSGERMTPGQGVVGLIPARGTHSLLVGSLSVSEQLRQKSCSVSVWQHIKVSDISLRDSLVSDEEDKKITKQKVDSHSRTFYIHSSVHATVSPPPPPPPLPLTEQEVTSQNSCTETTHLSLRRQVAPQTLPSTLGRRRVCTPTLASPG